MIGKCDFCGREFVPNKPGLIELIWKHTDEEGKKYKLCSPSCYDVISGHLHTISPTDPAIVQAIEEDRAVSAR